MAVIWGSLASVNKAGGVHHAWPQPPHSFRATCLKCSEQLVDRAVPFATGAHRSDRGTNHFNWGITTMHRQLPLRLAAVPVLPGPAALAVALEDSDWAVGASRDANVQQGARARRASLKRRDARRHALTGGST